MSETTLNLSGDLSVSLKRVRPLFDQAKAASIAVDDLLKFLGLPVSLPERPDSDEIPLSDYYRIQNRLAMMFGDETCHLSARQLLPGSTDFVLRHVHNSRNLFEAMQVIAESYNLLHGGQYNKVRMESGSVDYIIDDSNFPYTHGQDPDNIYFALECTLIFLDCMLMTVSPENATNAVRKLSLRRPEPDETCEHLSYWRAPIKFGASVYRVSFDIDQVLQPIAPPDATRLTSQAVQARIISAISQGDKSGMPSTVLRVRDALNRGLVDQQSVSTEFGISPATLRRWLSDEGTSFRVLRQEVLNERAKDLLKDQYSVTQVAEMLGFSEFRSFIRAFKAWNGLTPKAFMQTTAK